MLTTPPNPLASNDHPDNQMHVTTSHLSQRSPLRSAGFQIAIKSQNPDTSTMLSPKKQTDSFKFTFDHSVINSNGTHIALHTHDIHTSQVHRNPTDTSSPYQDYRYSTENSNSSSMPTQSNSSGFQTPPMQNSFASGANELIKKKMISTQYLFSVLVRLDTSSGSPKNSVKSNTYSCSHPDCRRVSLTIENFKRIFIHSLNRLSQIKVL